MPVNDPHTCAELAKLDKAVVAIGKKVDNLTVMFNDHITHESRLEEDIHKALDAFPDGPEKHKEAHQAMIDAALAQKKFWEDLSKDLLKWGIIGAISIICGFIILGIKAHVAGWFGK